MMLTQATLKHLFEYRDGQLIWKNPQRLSFTGRRAGYENGNGYRRMTIAGKQYFEHRVVYLMMRGEFPELIDHIDGNPANNRIENLRPATKGQNMFNSSVVRSQTGCKNVRFDKRRQTYCVALKINGKSKCLGSFKDLELADLVAGEARRLYHGPYANHSEAA